MPEKGFEFRSALKEKSAKDANKSFHANVAACYTFLAGSKYRDKIDRKVKDLGPVHTYTFMFVNASVFMRLGLPSTRKR